MNKQRRFLLSLTLFISLIGTGIAQQVGVNSPYGRYGYGLLSNQSIGSAESMGGVSYGLRRGQNINFGNPASYSAADSLNFTMEMGVSGQYSKLSDGIGKQTFENGNFDYLAFQFSAWKNLGMSVGILPYSKVGYDFGRDVFSNDLPYRETFSGAGGLSQIYGGIAYAPLEYLSVGVNLSYLFGSITNTSDMPTIYEDAETFNRLKSNRFKIKDLKLDFGVQFTYPINVNESVTLGVVYTPEINAKADIYPIDLLYSSTVETPLKTDTLYNQSFTLPESFGIGLAYKSANLTVGLDGTFQRWGGVQYPQFLDSMTVDTRFNDKYRVNLGVEYVADPVHRSFFKRMRYRGGLSYSNSYINTNVNDPMSGNSIGTSGYKEYGVNVGFGLPFRDMISQKITMVNIGFGYTLMQPDQKYMIKEELFKVSINLNINEFWFFKRQFD